MSALGALPSRYPAHPAMSGDWMMDVDPLFGWSLSYTKLPSNTDPLPNNRLSLSADKKTSVHGEEGVLAEIFRVIGTTNRWLCEFGARDGERESNTLPFVRDEGWHALYIEPEAAQFASVGRAGSSRPACARTLRTSPPPKSRTVSIWCGTWLNRMPPPFAVSSSSGRRGR